MNAPRQWEADIVLSDGGIAHLRAIQPGDRERMIRFYEHVSEESKYLRFFVAHPQLNESDLDRLINIDHHDRVTLVVTIRDEIIATANYGLVTGFLPARVGEVSFLVQDRHQGRGVANILLEHLAQVGRENHIERFFAEMLMANRTMVQVFIRAGYQANPAVENGLIVVDFPIDPTTASREVMEQRERKAEANAIRRILNPERIALIGATGQLRTELPQLEELEGDVDLVVAQYSADSVGGILKSAAARNANGVLLLAPAMSPLLTETDLHEFVATARAAGLRALGPAALGLINTERGLNLSPAPMPRKGKVGMFTQSAGVAAITLAEALRHNTGISSFIASGFFADVTGNDVMQFWAADERTEVCLLSLDAVGNPRKFFRVLRRLALEKPVVVFTPSRALLSARGAGADSAGPEALDQVIRQAGAMVVTRRETMYDIAQILARQPMPRGNRVRLLSNSQGLNEQMRHAAPRFGLVPDSRTVADLITATAEALTDPGVDAVIATIVEVDEPVMEHIHAELSRLAQHSRIPLIGVFVGFRELLVTEDYPEEQGQLPWTGNYAGVLEALGIIVHNELARAAARPTAEDEIFEGDAPGARDFVDKLLAGPAGWISDADCARLLAYYDITVQGFRRVDTVAEAIAAGAEAGWNVVLKATCDAARGRPELSTIIRDIDDAETMRHAWESLGGTGINLGLSTDGDVAPLRPVVQPMVQPGPSLTVHGLEDPVLGPMLSVGITGMASDLLGDLSWCVPPVRRTDARAMINGLQAVPLLHGYRSTLPSALSPLEDVLMRAGRLKDDLPAVAEIELTPILAGAGDTYVLGGRIRLVDTPDERDPLARTAS